MYSAGNQCSAPCPFRGWTDRRINGQETQRQREHGKENVWYLLRLPDNDIIVRKSTRKRDQGHEFHRYGAVIVTVEICESIFFYKFKIRFFNPVEVDRKTRYYDRM